jgi:hypothetical protein
MTTPQKPSLEAAQRWMQSVITHPQGVEAGLTSEAARSHLDVAPGDLESVIDRSQAQTSVERLGVYAAAYHSRLIECLEAEFPVFLQGVGIDAFAAFAFEYLKLYPSHNHNLSQLGANFHRFLKETKPSTNANQPAPDWPDFLLDLALLERTFSEVFDGPGVEGKQTLSANELLSIDPQRWPQARLTPVPCLRLLSLRFPLNDYYTAVKQGHEPKMPAATDSWLAITRRDYIVRRYQLNRTQFVLLNELRSGQTVGQAIAAAAETCAGPTESLSNDIRNWFQTWAAAPMFAAVELN